MRDRGPARTEQGHVPLASSSLHGSYGLESWSRLKPGRVPGGRLSWARDLPTAPSSVTSPFGHPECSTPPCTMPTQSSQPPRGNAAQARLPVEGAGLAPAPPPRAFVNTMATQVARCVAPPLPPRSPGWGVCVWGGVRLRFPRPWGQPWEPGPVGGRSERRELAR